MGSGAETTEWRSLQMITVRWWNASAYYGLMTARSLIQQGHPATVVSSPYYPVIQKAREWQLPTFTDVAMESLNPWQLGVNLRALKRVIVEKQINLLNVHRPEDHAHAALLRGLFRLPIPVVRTVTDVRSPKAHSLNRKIHEMYTDFFIFSTHASVARYQAVWPFFEEGRNFVVHPGAVDIQYFQPAEVNRALRRQWRVEETAVVFAMIARLSPVKGHRVFLEAAARVVKRVPRAWFLISGEAVEINHEELRVLANQLGLGQRLILLEKWQDVRELIRAVDVGVIASLDSEVVCRIGLEMMAMQKPLIATQVNVLNELVLPEKNGLLVPPGDATALANAMIYLAQHPAVITRMGETARKMVEQNYSPNVFVRVVLNAYHKAWENFKRNSI